MPSESAYSKALKVVQESQGTALTNSIAALDAALATMQVECDGLDEVGTQSSAKTALSSAIVNVTAYRNSLESTRGAVAVAPNQPES